MSPGITCPDVVVIKDSLQHITYPDRALSGHNSQYSDQDSLLHTQPKLPHFTPGLLPQGLLWSYDIVHTLGDLVLIAVTQQTAFPCTLNNHTDVLGTIWSEEPAVYCSCQEAASDPLPGQLGLWRFAL